MTKLKPYPEYKDAGVPWLEDVPECWPVVSTRVALRPMKVLAGTDPSKHQLLSLTKQGVIPRDMENAQGKHPENYDTYQVVDIDDLIFCLFDIDETPRTVGLVKEPGMLTGAYTRFKTTTAADPRFVCWYFLALDNGKRLKPLYTGLRKVIQKTRFLSAPMPLPELKVQRAIADFLDRETAQIDELIGKQERLIELLAEKRQAIITHAVTKGLDPAAPTKPSGIPWLGDVPAHWTVRKFSQVTAINGGQVDPRQEPWASMLLIAPNHVESGTGRITHRETSANQGADSGKYLVKAGEVIYSKIRPYLRKVVIAPEDCLCSGDMYGISASPEVMSNRFLQELMLSQPFTDFTADSSARVAMPKINRDSLAQGFLWYPPLSEQEAILSYIDRESALTDQLEGRARMFISLLRERRSALISAAVTGKIDVREGATQL